MEAATPAPVRLLRVDEVAELLGLSVPRTYEIVRERKLDAVRIGRSVRVDPRALEAFITAGGTPLEDD